MTTSERRSFLIDKNTLKAEPFSGNLLYSQDTHIHVREVLPCDILPLSMDEVRERIRVMLRFCERYENVPPGVVEDLLISQMLLKEKK